LVKPHWQNEWTLQDLQAVGLCHACYGTDSFSAALLPLEQRDDLTEALGVEAGAIVYRYASCDRKVDIRG
jgi:hypothetical protein